MLLVLDCVRGLHYFFFCLHGVKLTRRDYRIGLHDGVEN